MDYYFIYICDDKPSSEEHTIVLNHLNSLLPLPSNINHVYSDINSVPLLKCNSSYLAVINIFTKEKTIEWTNKTEELNLDHLKFDLNNEDTQKILEGDSNKISKENSPVKDAINQDKILSELLNNLADALPMNGSYKLDIIISQNVLKRLSAHKDIKFAGSLYRMLQWHSAHISIIVPQGEDELNLEEWHEILKAEVIKGKIDPFLGPLIWRGSIQFKNPDVLYSGFQLRLDPFESEITFDDTVTLSSDSKAISFEHLILSSNFQAIHECRFSSIPTYLILPIAFRLYTGEPNVCYTNSKKLLEGFRSNNGVALITRLKYTILHEELKPDRSLSTSKWQKMISSGNIKSPDNIFPVLERHLTFAITASPNSGHVVAYPLRAPSSLNAKFYFNSFNLMDSKSQCVEIDKTCGKSLLALELPYLPQHSFQALVNKVNLLDLSSKKACYRGEHSSTDNCCCLDSFLESVAKNLPSHSLVLDSKELHITEQEIDPSDWPERVYLLQKQMQIDKEKVNVQPVFRNLSPQRSQNTISFTSKDAEKYFLPTGESKKEINTGSVSAVTHDTKPASSDIEKLRQSEWPEALACKDDDIYYNSNKKDEDREAVGYEMVRFYVQHETASTCNNQQYRTDSTIVIRTKSKPSSQRFRSPATPRSFSRLNKNLGKSIDRSKQSQSNIPSAMMKKNSSVAPSIVIKDSNLKGKMPVKKNALPVRCSPRKKTAVMHSQPTVRTGEHKTKNSNPQQLTEIWKKKLRVAVASALEKNGINMSDTFFRPCGKRLFIICQAFVEDIPHQTGSVSQHMQKIADAHVKQVIEFERQRLSNLKGKQDAGNVS